MDNPFPHLSDEHWRMLAVESAISAEIIKERGYRTITDPKDFRGLGFATNQQWTPGLLIPVYAPDGSLALHQYRPDYPRQKKNRKGELLDDVIKYETPKGAGMRVDVPPACRAMLADPSIPLWLTEGVKKGDALATVGLCAVDLLGVWNFKGKNEFGGVTILADFDAIAWPGRDVRIVFDSDIMHKRPVQLAMERLREILQRKGVHVSVVYLPGGAQQKIGVDDFLREHGRDELEALVNAPRPVPQAAPPTFELLDESPPAMRRPLQLVNGKAYAATWLHVKKIVSETVDEKTGCILKHNPPLETVTREIFVIREDGATFGHGAAHPLADLGFEVVLPEIPPEHKLMNKAAVLPFIKRQRNPQAPEIFERVRSVADCFIDFERSLANQQEMSELVACYILATWYLDAFNVAGYVWPIGERGSGKTQLLTLIAEMAYLGQVVLASGTLATLRDMADYGAFLGFDDAENLTNARQTDPDKRTLLLAGNRRGNTIPVKEPLPAGKGWRTRYVSTFCFRGFTATRTPDPILGSRTITIPLVRTADRFKANADPLDFTLWPSNRNTLIGDLWCLALANLSALPKYDQAIGQRASLSGRNLEPWRGILAVALWLDDNGLSGLFQRMNALSVAYQTERSELEGADLTRLVLRAITRHILPDAAEPFQREAIAEAGKEWRIRTKDITAAACAIVTADELDFDLTELPKLSRRIGKSLSRLRFENAKVGEKSERGWRITNHELLRSLQSFALLSTNETSATSETSETTCDIEAGQVVSDITDITDVYTERTAGFDAESDEDRRFRYLERASIAEFDGGLSRNEAEHLAALDVYELADASQ